MRLGDTIVAVASPPGTAPRGLVRLSGPDAPNILDTLGVTLPEPYRLGHARVAGVPCLAWRSAAPRTYTGEDTAEFLGVGHPTVLRRWVDACVTAGARRAEPGEFSYRAFAHRRITLTQAEGVAAAIAALGDAQLAAAHRLQRGHLGHAATTLADRLATLLALVEAGIDFVDQDDVVPIAPGILDDALAELLRRLADLTQQARRTHDANALPRVVLAGPPSAGKSTLFNALLGHTRAVVAPEPGTTRDAIREPIALPNGTQALLTDLAGLTDDHPLAAIDRAAQDRARRVVHNADLILRIASPDTAATPLPRRGVGAKHSEADGASRPVQPAPPTLHVWTKSDAAPPPDATWLPVSAHAGTGLDPLRAAIAQHLANRATSATDATALLHPRHTAALADATDALQAARQTLAASRSNRSLADPELIAGALRAALDALAGLAGEHTPDDVLGRVFSAFCVGK